MKNKRITFWLTPELHNIIKVLCAKEFQTMTDYFMELLETDLRKRRLI